MTLCEYKVNLGDTKMANVNNLINYIALRNATKISHGYTPIKHGYLINKKNSSY